MSPSAVGLPPLSSFRASAPVALHSTTMHPSSRIGTINGVADASVRGSQTGDALGKALASVGIF